MERIWSRIEVLLAVVLLSACVWQTGRTMTAMATSSLWTDEYGTVGTFSSKGPLRVVTDYRKPKNHVFFNLVNSVLPGRESFNPARVRMLSIGAAGAFLVILVAYGIWRRALFESSVVLTLWTFSVDSLPLGMEARGYGFLTLATLISFIGVTEYFRTSRAAWLYTAAGAVVLGTYTIPAFLIYGGPLMLLVWALRPTKRTFIVGVATAALIGLLYSPLASQFLTAFQSYGDQYGEGFNSLGSITKSMSVYLLAMSPTAYWLLIGGLLVAAVFAGVRWPERRGLLVVMGAAVAFFVVLLILRTSPLRMTNMGWVPFMLAGIFGFGACLAMLPWAGRAVIMIGVFGFLLAKITPSLRTFQFEPQENWVLAGDIAHQAFPKSAGIEYLRYAKYLLYTLPDAKKRSADFDEKAYLAGEIIVVDSANIDPSEWSRGQVFKRPAEEPHNATIVMWGGGRNFFYTFQIPQVAHLLNLSPQLSDRDASTGLPLNEPGITLPAQDLKEGQSVVLLFQGEAKNVTFSAKEVGTSRDLSDLAIVTANSIIFPVPKTEGEKRSIEFTLRSASHDTKLVEVWATPPQ